MDATQLIMKVSLQPPTNKYRRENSGYWNEIYSHGHCSIGFHAYEMLEG